MGKMSVLSASSDKTMKLWDFENEVVTSTFIGHDAAIVCLAVDWASRRALSGTRGASKWRCPRGYDSVRSGGSETGKENLRLWDLDTGNCLKSFDAHETKDVLAVSMNWSQRRALSAGSDDCLRLWNLDLTECIASLSGHTNFVSCLQVDWAALRAVSGAADAQLRVWDLTEKKCLSVWEFDGPDTSMGRGQLRSLALEHWT